MNTFTRILMTLGVLVIAISLGVIAFHIGKQYIGMDKIISVSLLTLKIGALIMFVIGFFKSLMNYMQSLVFNQLVELNIVKLKNEFGEDIEGKIGMKIWGNLIAIVICSITIVLLTMSLI